MPTNTFFIAANVVFDLDTGKRSNVLILVNSERDATYFPVQDAKSYLEFISRRAPEIMWEVHATNQRIGMFVIKGVQIV